MGKNDNSFEILRNYLKAFTQNEILGSSPELSKISDILTYNKIEPLISYVSYGYESAEYSKWEKNKSLNFKRIKACKEIFNALEEQKILYAVIKGAHLDKVAYKDIGLRFSYDIDFLIEKKNYKTLHKLMTDFGFVAGEWNVDEKRIEVASRESMLYNYIYTHQAAPYVKIQCHNGCDQDISVDLNFSISWGEDKQGVDLTTNLLENTQIVEYGNIKYRVLNPEFFLIQICMHAYRDMNSLFLIKTGKLKLRLLCDVFYYVYFNSNNLDADKFINICRKYKYEKYIYYVLYYTTEVFDHFPWIDYVMKSIRPSDTAFLETYGIAADEIRRWPINFRERVMSCDAFDTISSCLTEKDIKKINIINDNMQHRIK